MTAGEIEIIPDMPNKANRKSQSFLYQNGKNMNFTSEIVKLKKCCTRILVFRRVSCKLKFLLGK